MSIRLTALGPSADRERLADRLAPGFGGDRDAALELLTLSLDHLARVPRREPWGSYVAWDGDTAVGVGAFKTEPDGDGAVEIAYMTLPAHEGKGYATATAGALSRIALDSGAALVVGETLPQENASNRALRRNGFTFGGEVVDPEDGPVWRWEKRA